MRGIEGRMEGGEKKRQKLERASMLSVGVCHVQSADMLDMNKRAGQERAFSSQVERRIF